MQLRQALRLINSWAPFSKLSTEQKAKLADTIHTLRLRPGQKLYDFSDLPPGIALIAEGQMRLLALDEREEPFTLYRLSPGDQAGHIGILRGVTGYALAASQPSLLWLLPQTGFLQVIAENAEFANEFIEPNIEELYGVSVLTTSPLNNTKNAIKDWASNKITESKGDHKILLLSPGEHIVDSKWGPWLVSSSNISGCKPGEELLGPMKLMVQGKIPARLISKDGVTPPINVPQVLVVSPDSSEVAPLQLEAEVVEPDWQESSTAIVAVEKQQEALEDWYGKLGDDGSFPQLDGSGPVGIPMAVLRMLARYFDIPFRKDVIQRIIEDQLV